MWAGHETRYYWCGWVWGVASFPDLCNIRCLMYKFCAANSGHCEGLGEFCAANNKHCEGLGEFCAASDNAVKV